MNPPVCINFNLVSERDTIGGVQIRKLCICENAYNKWIYVKHNSSTGTRYRELATI